MATTPSPAQTLGSAADEAIIRRLVADFAAGWNRHDPAATLTAFADDVEHVSVRGRWQRGRAEIEQIHRDYHATIWAEVTYNPGVEQVLFVRPDVAVAIVHGTFRSSSGAEEEARATWVMSKEEGRWLVRAFHQTRLQDVPIAPSTT